MGYDNKDELYTLVLGVIFSANLVVISLFYWSYRMDERNLPTISEGIPEFEITVDHDEAMTTSLKIAEMFEKRHDRVIRAIENILDTANGDEFSRLNFGVSSYKDKSGKKSKSYTLTRSAFSMIVMGFTGVDAYRFKVEYIKRFEAMEELIRSRLISKGGYKIMTDAISEYIANDWREYTKEADMINRVVLGMTSKQFKQLNGLGNKEAIRDSAVLDKLNDLDKAQRLNAQLITAQIPHSDRFNIISSNYDQLAF